MRETARTLLNNPRTEPAVRATAWALLALAIAGLIRMILADPWGPVTYPTVITLALAAGAASSVLTLARHALEEGPRRGRLPLRDLGRVLLVLAVCCLIPQNQAAIYACIALMLTAVVIILVDTNRTTRTRTQPRDTQEPP